MLNKIFLLFALIVVANNIQAQNVTGQKSRSSSKVALTSVETIKVSDVVSQGGQVSYTGTTFPYQYTTIRSSQSGYVEKILVRAGDKVKQGQVLANIDLALNEGRKNQSYNALNKAMLTVFQQEINLKTQAYSSASNQAAVKNAYNQWMGEKQLFEQNLSSEARLNQAESNYNSAKAMYESSSLSLGSLNSDEISKLNLKETAQKELQENGNDITAIKFNLALSNPPLALQQSINDFESAKAAYRLSLNDYRRALGTAPFAGQVLKVGIEIGQFVNAGDALFTIGDLNKMKLKIYLSAKDTNTAKEGMEVNVAFDTIPGKVFKGKIKSVSLDADPASLTYSCEIEIDNSKNEIRSGETAKIYLSADSSAKKIIVPIETVLQSPNEKYVFTVDEMQDQTNGVARKKVVQVGSLIGNQIEIKSGLNAGDLLINKSQQYVKDGDKVTIIGSN